MLKCAGILAAAAFLFSSALSGGCIVRTVHHTSDATKPAPKSVKAEIEEVVQAVCACTSSACVDREQRAAEVKFANRKPPAEPTADQLRRLRACAYRFPPPKTGVEAEIEEAIAAICSCRDSECIDRVSRATEDSLKAKYPGVKPTKDQRNRVEACIRKATGY